MPASLSVVLPYWLDRPPLEALEIARNAEASGFHTLWVGEMMTFDAFALASAIVRETSRLRLTVGPLAIGVRSPASFALGIASVTTLGARRADLALGASNPLVIGGWHGRPFDHPVSRMREVLEVLRPLLRGERSAFTGEYEQSHGFRLAADPPHSTLTVAAFGEKMLTVAAEADRVVVNLLAPEQLASAKAVVAATAARAGRAAPPLAAWVPVAIDPGPAAWQQLARQLVVYIGAPGYGEMFAAAGFSEVVALARSGAHPRDVMKALPRELMTTVGAIGNESEVRRRLAAYAEAGADEIGIVPVTADDPAGKKLLRTLSPH